MSDFDKRRGMLEGYLRSMTATCDLVRKEADLFQAGSTTGVPPVPESIYEKVTDIEAQILKLLVEVSNAKPAPV